MGRAAGTKLGLPTPSPRKHNQRGHGGGWGGAGAAIRWREASICCQDSHSSSALTPAPGLGLSPASTHFTYTSTGGQQKLLLPRPACGAVPVTYRAPHLKVNTSSPGRLCPPVLCTPKGSGNLLQRAPPLTALPFRPQQNTFPRVLSWLFLNELSSLLASGTPQDLPQTVPCQPTLHATTKTIKSVNTFQQPTAEGNWQACKPPRRPSSQTHCRLTHPYLLRQNTPTPTENIHSHKVLTAVFQ